MFEGHEVSDLWSTVLLADLFLLNKKGGGEQPIPVVPKHLKFEDQH